MMKISVLICVYRNDSVTYLSEALQSIFDQSYKPAEIIIVRDGSVPAELQQFLDHLKISSENIELFELEENVGLSRALNFGIGHCKYDFIARMDSDDVSIPERFAEQMAMFQNDPSLALVSSWYEQYNEDMTVIESDRKVPLSNEEVIKFSKRRTPFNHSAAIFKKDAVIAAGMYPNTSSFCEDWWLALKMLKRGYKIANVQKSLLKVRGGKEFFSRRTGMRYLRIEIHNLYEMYKHSLISIYDLIINVIIRLPIRLLPQTQVKSVYTKLIRNIQ